MTKRKTDKKARRSKKKDTSQKVSFQASIKNWFQDRHPILKFLLPFLGCIALFYLFFYSPIYRDFLEKPFLSAQAYLSSGILNIFGYTTETDGGRILGHGYSVDIKNGCDGLEAIAILMSGILIFPTSIRNKLPGMGIGFVVLLILNLFRIVGLYIAGLNVSEETFELLHVQGGFIVFTVISVLLWFVWMSWVMKKGQA